MTLDSAILKALLVSAFAPITAVAQGAVAGDGHGWEQWPGGGDASTGYSTTYPTDGGYGQGDSQWSQQAPWGGDQWNPPSSVPMYGGDGRGGVAARGYQAGAYSSQSTRSSKENFGAFPHVDDPYATGYTVPSGGGYSASPAPAPISGYGDYGAADSSPQRHYYPNGDFASGNSVYPAPYTDSYAPASGYGGANAVGYSSGGWSGGGGEGLQYPSAAPSYGEYPTVGYPNSDFSGGDRRGTWESPNPAVKRDYGYSGGYPPAPRRSYQGGYSQGGGYAPPTPAEDNPWARAAAGYSREPVEDFRDQQRRENPWAFVRPEPAREEERRRWREQPARPWAREGEERYGAVSNAPPYSSPRRDQGYGAPAYDYSYPGYGWGDGYYPGGNLNPWPSWGRGLPGGSWGAWPSMPWNW